MKTVLLVLLSSLSLMAAITEVTVSILPQKFFIEKIAQDKIKVNVMVKQGFSPATYEPKTSQMKRLFFSDVYFAIGVPFEQVWLKRFQSANSKMQIVDTSRGIEKLPMQAHEHEDEHKHEHEHDHEDQHKEEKVSLSEHHHEGLDPHIWLDPILVKQQAKTMLDTLCELDASNKAFYTQNYNAFIKELDALHNDFNNQLIGLKKSPFMVFHPSWGYFAKRYDLEQIAVEKEGKEPKPKELTKLIKEAKVHHIKVVFVAPQFSQKAASVIAQGINANVVIMDPLSYDYMNNLRKVVNSIQDSYK